MENVTKALTMAAAALMFIAAISLGSYISRCVTGMMDETSRVNYIGNAVEDIEQEMSDE